MEHVTFFLTLNPTKNRLSIAAILGIVGVVVALIVTGRIVQAIATVPTTADALRMSLQAIGNDTLIKAVAARP